jgi:hypothetical protein
MNTYIINSGVFNLLITDFDGSYYILRNDQTSAGVVQQFISGESLDTQKLDRHNFSFSASMKWHDMDGKEMSLSDSSDVVRLMEIFAQKKNNFGGIVATRNEDTGKVKIFKKQKLLLS